MLAAATGVLAAALAAVVVLAVSAFSGPPRATAPRPSAPASSPAPSEAPSLVLTSDFEDGTAQGWQAAPGGRTQDSTTVAHDGRHALLVGRAGAGRDLRDRLSPGTGYTLSAWVRRPDGAPSGTVRLVVTWGWASATQDTLVATGPAGPGGWARISGEYSPVTAVDVLTVRIEPSGDPAGLYLDDFTVTRLGPASPPAVPALKDVFAGSFDLGAAVSSQQLTGPESGLVKTHFNSVTPTSAMKWTATEPAPGVFTFDAADKIVDFATANGMKVRGHTLVWHNQTPDWVFQDEAGQPMTPTPQNKALLLSRLDHHIEAVVGRYRGRISSWDVVNEAVKDDGTLRQSRWYQIAGPDYISRAFLAARAADPGAKLCINDVNLTTQTRRDAMYDLVAGLKAQGVPIDCIGNQTHVNIQVPTPAAVAASIEKFATLGVEQQITEMDMSVYTDNTSSYPAISADLLARQAAQYRALFAVYRKYRNLLGSVTFWGVADNQTWLSSYPIVRTDAPLLFDADLRPKPAFWAVAGDRG